MPTARLCDPIVNVRLPVVELNVAAVGVNPYSDKKRLIRKKCGEDQPCKAGPAIIHGVKY